MLKSFPRAEIETLKLTMMSLCRANSAAGANVLHEKELNRVFDPVDAIQMRNHNRRTRKKEDFAGLIFRKIFLAFVAVFVADAPLTPKNPVRRYPSLIFSRLS